MEPIAVAMLVAVVCFFIVVLFSCCRAAKSTDDELPSTLSSENLNRDLSSHSSFTSRPLTPFVFDPSRPTFDHEKYDGRALGLSGKDASFRVDSVGLIEVTFNYKESEEMSWAVTEKPFSRNHVVNYVEVIMVELDEVSSFCVGFTLNVDDDLSSEDLLVVWKNRITDGIAEFDLFGPGDIIGLGYVPESGEVFFYSNGTYLGKVIFTPFLSISFVIGCNGYSKIKVNLGAAPFMSNVQDRFEVLPRYDSEKSNSIPFPPPFLQANEQSNEKILSISPPSAAYLKAVSYYKYGL